MNENKQHDDARPQPSPTPQHPVPPYPYYYPPPYEDEDEIDLLDLWRVLWKNKWLIVLITVLSTAVALAAALWMTPIYRSEALLAPATDGHEDGMSRLGQFGGIAAMAGIDIGTMGGPKEEAIALLKSRALTEEFIEDEGLMKILYDEKWNEETQQWEVEDPKQIPTMWYAYKKFNGIRSVSEDRDSGLVTLAIEWKDPKLAAEWVAKLVDRVNEKMRQRAIKDAERSLEYLTREISKTGSVEVQEAIYRIMESQIKQIMLANVRDEYSFKVIDPPAVPDLRDEVKPKKKLMVILGFVLGGFGGVFIAFFKNYIQNVKAREKDLPQTHADERRR
ncbi:MAG: hypothetical protein K9K88_16750 [Desulfobacterales bacterium]|nr:hypothetical protein [Desulfobacterales bacterium]